MASIPLAEIPGVSQLSAPVLGDGIRARASAQGLLSDTVSPGAFAGPGQGMEMMGHAVAGTASVFDTLRGHLQEAQNVGDMSRANVIMQNAYGEHAKQSMTLPADQRTALWETDFRPKVEKQLADLRMSPMVASRVMPEWATFDAKTRTNIAYDAYKTQIGQNVQAVENERQTFLDNKDPVGADAASDKKLAFGYTPEAVAAEKIQNKKTSWSQNEYDQTQAIAAAIDTDASKAIPELQKAAAGEASVFGPHVDQVKALRMLGRAKEADRSQVIQIRTDLHNAIIDGSITDPQTLSDRNEATGSRMTPGMMRSLTVAMGKEIPFDPENVTKIRTEISNYDPDKDEGRGEYNRIMSGIEMGVPQKRQDILVSELKKRLTDAPDAKSAFLGKVNTDIDEMATRGLFGKYWSGAEKPNQKGSVIDDQLKQKSWVTAETNKQAMRDFLKKNPDATPAEANAHLQGLIGPDGISTIKDIMLQRQSANNPGWFKRTWNSAVGNATPGVPDESTVSMIKGYEAFTPQAYHDGKQISVGYGTRAQNANETLTEPQADARLRSELAMHARNVDALAAQYGTKMTRNQRAALISFDYNTGAADKVFSATGGDMKSAPTRMGMYRMFQGQVNSGLIARRKSEIDLFNK